MKIIKPLFVLGAFSLLFFFANCEMADQSSGEGLEVAFMADKTTVEAGQSIFFKDESEGDPTGWDWIFPGGTPGFASTSSVTVTYSTPGTYEVTLTIKKDGATKAKTYENYITVTEPAGGGDTDGPG